MTATTVDSAPRRGSSTLAVLQRIGRSLMLPIAVLPAAALLLRFGQADMLGADGLGWDRVAEIVGEAGNALFAALPLLFAVGVAIGFAKKSDGSTALAAVVGYLVFDRVSKIMFSHTDELQGNVLITKVTDEAQAQVIDWGAKNPTDVLGGILMGVIAALLYQRYYRIKLPTWLAFFGGRRFVPIITAVAGLALGIAIGFIWPLLGSWLTDAGEWITGAGAAGAGIYGVINRLLLPFGLHHIPNSLIWFVFGDYNTADGVVHGEINRYLAGDPDAGGFLAGFFPVLMFGLPGAALAMWHAAPKHRRPAVGGIMISAALTAFVTGVTEPIEFAFMFVAPVLYGVHVVLTGISMAVLEAAGAKLGFGFSAGGIDLLLNARKDNTSGLLLILGMGVLYFFLYYFIFRFLITRFNFATPGREPEGEESTAADPAASPELAGGEKKAKKRDRKGTGEPQDSPAAG
ncbi:PTS system, N-acetylglucosamine-specific IIC component [Actinomadura meyerae]|jgi:PTS system N-acetylglucosamine-specific IIC component|uniref:PTS system, N-acetylglucosamine-specific IIC component n=1 Tax=Actinomadura meyerae TaxID=240840 RepID=A0A239I5R3_9ACTN|nr:PTS transporter subunit EIIC [Actinomadura meyerae]SNS88831.1 PTS system, N-acetylglucosamine-specific IIC component [Actinomadura meyerae]